MFITSTLSFKHSNWQRAKEICKIQNEPTSKTEIFDRLVDLFIVSCTLGIHAGQRLENDLTEEVHSVSSKVINENNNVSEIFDYITKIIILICDEPELKEMSKKHKEILAFENSKSDDEESEEHNPDKVDFSKIKPKINSILCSYANYGLGKVLEAYSSHNLELIFNIYNNIGDIMKQYEELPDLEQFGNFEF